MKISKKRNLIIDSATVKVVPISNSLNDIDSVKSIVEDILRDEELENKVLSIKGYLINEDDEHAVVNKKLIQNIRCPYRDIYRTIK